MLKKQHYIFFRQPGLRYGKYPVIRNMKKGRDDKEKVRRNFERRRSKKRYIGKNEEIDKFIKLALGLVKPIDTYEEKYAKYQVWRRNQRECVKRYTEKKKQEKVCSKKGKTKGQKRGSKNKRSRISERCVEISL